MKNEKLTGDEYDALGHIERGAAHDRVNACVGRNAKRLSGLKMIEYARDGKVALTEKGRQVLFLRRCVAALKALVADPAAKVDTDVAQFLTKKSHIAEAEGGGHAITERGRESLADIEAQDKK
jgi:Mn-dependent DtxR family transcriptional regulator